MPELAGRSARDEFRGPEVGGTGATDRVDRPHTPPRRRDRSIEAVAAHCRGVTTLNGPRHGPIAVRRLDGATRPLLGRGPTPAGPARLLAAGGHRPPPRTPARVDRDASEPVRAA